MLTGFKVTQYTKINARKKSLYELCKNFTGSLIFLRQQIQSTTP